jgi:acetate kinase
MGFTPMDGLVMATRSGSFDPGALLWLARRSDMRLDDLEHELLANSGLLALAGTDDMRDVTDAARRGDAAAQLALDVYLHRLRKLVAAMVGALGGIDALVFTAGVGENSALVRDRTVHGLAFLGLAIDPEKNEMARPDVDISAEDATVRTLVIAAREDLEIVRGVREVLAREPRRSGRR